MAVINRHVRVLVLEPIFFSSFHFSVYTLPCKLFMPLHRQCIQIFSQEKQWTWSLTAVPSTAIPLDKMFYFFTCLCFLELIIWVVMWNCAWRGEGGEAKAVSASTLDRGARVTAGEPPPLTPNSQAAWQMVIATVRRKVCTCWLLPHYRVLNCRVISRLSMAVKKTSMTLCFFLSL